MYIEKELGTMLVNVFRSVEIDKVDIDKMARQVSVFEEIAKENTAPGPSQRLNVSSLVNTSYANMSSPGNAKGSANVS